MRERPARLARPQPGVDPRLVEEPLPDRRQLRAERAVGGQHLVPRLVPADRAVLVAGQGRVAVPVL